MQALHSVLNMPKYASSEYISRSKQAKILNMPKLPRVLNMPQYG